MKEEGKIEQERIWDYFQNEKAELFERSKPRMEYIVNRIPVGARALNIGVGGGILEKLSIEKGINIHSIDPSDRTIESLKKKFGPSVKAKSGYSDDIPFPDEVFDVVVMSEVLEHLDDIQIKGTLMEVKRVLRCKGKFIVTVPFNENLADNLVICPCCNEKFHRWGHKQSFSLDEIDVLIKEAGFYVSRLETRSFPDWSRSGVFSLMKSSLRYFAGRVGLSISCPNIYMEASKGG